MWYIEILISEVLGLRMGWNSYREQGSGLF